MLIRCPVNYESLRDDILNNGMSICILDEYGQISGCAGIVFIWQGVGEVWSIFNNNMLARPLSIVRIMKTLIKKLRDSKLFHRVQMTIYENQPGLTKWAESLGFQFEGRMLKYGPDQKTHLRYALIF